MPKGNGSQVIYCPICIMTKPEAFGGQTSHSMTWDMAETFFESHWHTPAQALELGYTTRMVQGEARPEPPETLVGQRAQNHPSQQVPPGMIQGEALTPALAIQDVSGRVEQSPLAVMVEDLKAEVNTLKAEVYELKEEVRALKEQVSGQPSQSSSVPARMIHVHR